MRSSSVWLSLGAAAAGKRSQIARSAASRSSSDASSSSCQSGNRVMASHRKSLAKRLPWNAVSMFMPPQTKRSRLIQAEQPQQLLAAHSRRKVQRHVVDQPVEQRLLPFQDAIDTLFDGILAGILDYIHLDRLA